MYEHECSRYTCIFFMLIRTRKFLRLYQILWNTNKCDFSWYLIAKSCMYVLYRHSRGRYVLYVHHRNAVYPVYISVLWRRHTLKLRLTIWGKSASYICSHTIICHRGPPRLPLSHWGFSGPLAIRRDCPCKIKFVCGGSADNVNSALCGLYCVPWVYNSFLVKSWN